MKTSSQLVLQKDDPKVDIREMRTKKMLLDAFEELNQEKSIGEMTVSELCDRSTVRRATFYRHFEDKYAFYEYYLGTLTEQLLAQAEEYDDVDLRTYTTSMHTRLIDFIEKHSYIAQRDIGRTALAGTLDMMMREIAIGIVRHINREVEERGIELDIPSEFLGMLYAGGMMHTLRWWIMEDKPISAEELERYTTDFFMQHFER